jgi:membrane-associated phospholipid phosphatase
MLEMPTRALLGAGIVVMSLVAGPARAADEDSTTGPRFPFRAASTADYAVIAAGAVTYGALAFLVPPADDPRWASPILFDARARRSWIGPTASARHTADWASHITILSSLALLASDGVVLGLTHDDWELAKQVLLMDAEVLVITGTLIHSLQLSVARARPDIVPCREDAAHSDHCSDSANTSFPSGHSAMAFASAATFCAQRLRLQLYGHPAADAVGCGVLAGGAFATAALRVVADRHHLSDVSAGALLGTAVGLSVPLVLRSRATASGDSAPSVTLLPALGSAPGIWLAGSF